MYQELNDYLEFQSMKYIMPEKAGPLKDDMQTFKAKGQLARNSFTELSRALEQRMDGFKMQRVSNWANQAQVGRPHFWVYYRKDTDQLDDVAVALRVYGVKDSFGVSLEVSFVERQKSDKTLEKQARVLSIPIASPLYFMVQRQGKTHREEGNEENRQRLMQEIKSGKVRKVLVKYDVLLTENQSLENILQRLLEGFEKVLPYYQVCQTIS
ncbi:TPA: ribonuclease P [Streptococcus agalactiae]